MKKLALVSILFLAAAPVLAQNPGSIEGDKNSAVKDLNAAELLRQGQTEFQAKNYAQAESSWKKAIEKASKEGDNKSKAESLCGLAIVYTKQTRISDAKKASDDAINFITSTFGENDPRLALLKKLSEGASSACVAPSVDETGSLWMKNIEAGTAAMNAGNIAAAISSFESALAIVDQSQPDSRVAAATLSPLAAAYLKAGNLKKAEATIGRALPLAKKYFADQPKLIEALQTGLASIKANQKTQTKAD